MHRYMHGLIHEIEDLLTHVFQYFASEPIAGVAANGLRQSTNGDIILLIERMR